MTEEQPPTTRENDTEEQAVAFERCISILEQMAELTGEDREVREEEKGNREMRNMLGQQLEELSQELIKFKSQLSPAGLTEIKQIQETN